MPKLRYPGTSTFDPLPLYLPQVSFTRSKPLGPAQGGNGNIPTYANCSKEAPNALKTKIKDSKHWTRKQNE